MGRMTAQLPSAINPRVSPITEQSDLTKPPVTRYLLQLANVDLYLDRVDAEQLHRDLDCLLGEPDAHHRARCLHSRHG